MKRWLIRTLKGLAFLLSLLGAVTIGSLPFLVSMLLGLAIRRPVIAYATALALTAIYTWVSAAYPGLIRSAHNGVKLPEDLHTIGFLSSLLLGMAWNLFFAHLGVTTGIALKEGYKTRKAAAPSAHPSRSTQRP